jgi:hypothetical protein
MQVGAVEEVGHGGSVKAGIGIHEEEDFMAGKNVGEDEGGEVGEDLLAWVGRVDALGP